MVSPTNDILCLQYWNESNSESTIVVKDHLLVQRNFESANESLVPISKRSSFRASNISVPTSGKREVRRARTHFQALSWCRNTTSVFTFNQQVFNYSLVANNSKESHYYLQLCFMQVLRDHELVLSCTRNLVLVFSIVILFTTQDVFGESILPQSHQFSEKKKLDDKIKKFPS